MSKKNIVEHMENGVRVQCADGTVVTCQPLMLPDAKFFIDQFQDLESAEIDTRIGARFKIAQRFAELYPELAAHIGMGDVEALLVSFFWRTTGASVVPANGRTGTPSTRTISPAGANSPAPR